MDSSLKQRWVRALRSGKYTQATGALRTEDGFCCLGVLCDVYDPENWTLAPHEELGHESQEWHYKSTNRPNDRTYWKDVLPNEIVEFAGFDTGNPEVPYEVCDGKTSLAVINDRGATFAQIADLIETHL